MSIKPRSDTCTIPIILGMVLAPLTSGISLVVSIGIAIWIYYYGE